MGTRRETARPFDGEPTTLRRAVVEGRPLPEPLPVDELDEQLVALGGATPGCR
ncbi:hypothetical protein [Kitasatospora sp. NPDC091207]|uniref:hypothetical protein n=1 Tax=Kitasatospora sp. NPDC091207 TaxID=3364083 RepID=UPI00381F987E